MNNENITNLASLRFFTGLRVLRQELVSNRSCRRYVLPDSLTTIESYCFQGDVSWAGSTLDVTAIFPSSLQTSRSNLFYYALGRRATYIYKGLTPPVLPEDFNVGYGASLVAIYVPDESVDLYKADQYFSNVANFILPLSKYIGDYKHLL